MHVDPTGASDNVYRVARPGDKLLYTFGIPKDHPPGTFWLHPHNHGSITFQLVSGMAATIIVDDPPAPTTPAWLLEVPDTVMVLQQVNFDDPPVFPVESYIDIAKKSGNLLPDDVTYSDPKKLVYALVNGQYMPVQQMTPAMPQRWRLVNAAIDWRFTLSPPQGCTMLLVAMDGIYLQSPRNKTEEAPVVIPPGGRADLIVTCQDGTHKLVSKSNPRCA